MENVSVVVGNGLREDAIEVRGSTAVEGGAFGRRRLSSVWKETRDAVSSLTSVDEMSVD